jgi:type II secretory pathway pseudopilin PulG
MKRRSLTLAELVVVVAVMTFLAGVLMPGLRSPRERAIRLVCQTNLRGIGKGMIAFAAGNGGVFPRAGGPGATWTPYGTIHSWYGRPNFSEDEAFDIIRDASGEITVPGEATITSSFYLLIKHAMAKPKRFVCPGDKGAQAFDITKTREWRTQLVRQGRGLEDVFDFGTRYGGVFPGVHCSYAYHMPYRAGPFVPSFAILDWSHPRSPVAADRNPHLDENAVAPEIHSNSMCHGGRGQNVLYKDGSVRFETGVTVGLGGDNIYTYGEAEPSSGDPNGTPPAGDGDGAPMGLTDAYLVGEQNYL